MKVKTIPVSIYHSLRLMSIPVGSLLKAHKKEVPVIVSLTSIPSRLGGLYIVIRSILDQTVHPKKIVLWLHTELKGQIPDNLAKLQGDLFEIRFSELNCSHRKLIHSLQAFPDDAIITCDDDFIYRRNWLELLYEEHRKTPDHIIANQVRCFRKDAKGSYLPYRQWICEDPSNTPSNEILPIGAAGVIYPPGSMPEQTLDSKHFLKLAPRADDLWFKAMAIIADIPTRWSENRPKEPIPLIGSQTESLKDFNIKQDKNREQWEAIVQHFGLDSNLPNEEVKDREIMNSLKVLRAGKTLVYPTDTVWGIGCDATDPKAVSEIYKLKQREESKALICLVSDREMLAHYIHNIPDSLGQTLKEQDKPTTVIYNKPTGLATNLIGADDTIGIRIASDSFCRELIRAFGKPIVSTSANPSEEPTPRSFKEIDPAILKGVHYVVNLKRNLQLTSPSRIIKLADDGTMETIRE